VSWFAVTENRFDNFMIAAERLKAGKNRFGPEVHGSKG
jgi:hypothetical protein